MAADAARAPDDQPKAKIFISYSRKDTAFAVRLEAALKERGFEPLIDRQDPIALQDWSKGIAPFEDWWKRIESLIGQADTIVFVLSPDSVASRVARDEINYAISLNKRFAPIVCRPVSASEVPEALRRLNFIFFDDASRFDASADHLAAALQIDLDWIRKHSDYGVAARTWVKAGRPGRHGMLLRSPVLEEAERWIAARPHSAPPPTDETVAFVEESRRAAIWRQRRLLTLAAAALLVIAAVLTAWWQQDWLKPRVYALMNVNALTAAQEKALKPGQSFNECTDCPDMVAVPSGSFMMGSSTLEAIGGHEYPQHAVTIDKPFAVSKYAVTFAAWDVCAAQGGCATHVSDNGWGRGQRPIINVDWNDVHAYVAWLSRVTGRSYRLLSEAEYEYAMRAGAATLYPWGDTVKLDGKPMANCKGCGSQWGDKSTAPVGSFPPNQFGLYDMAGNVFAWTEDCDHASYEGAPVDGAVWQAEGHGDCSQHIIRGGSWDTAPDLLRSVARMGWPVDFRATGVGFRVARTLAP